MLKITADDARETALNKKSFEEDVLIAECEEAIQKCSEAGSLRASLDVGIGFYQEAFPKVKLLLEKNGFEVSARVTKDQYDEERVNIEIGWGD